MKSYYLENGSRILVDDTKAIGQGGEGSVFKLAKNADILAKVYNKRALDRMPEIEHKIKAMVKKKPGLLNYNGLTIIAWPTHVIYDHDRRFCGYLMRRVQAKNQLSHVITPGLQKRKFPSITWYDRVVIAINLAKVMSYLHQNDTVIGDINTSDFFVYPAFEIGLVDTDSFQIQSDTKLYHCKVFTPDYTPPEVIEAKKHTHHEVRRLPNHDNYGLAILIFQILMFGVHPFSARIRHAVGFDGNAINYNMEREIFPYDSEHSNIVPPKNAMPFSFFPKPLRELFIEAFRKHETGVERPSASAWVDVLRGVKDHLKKCRKKAEHLYPSHFHKCPICVREKMKNYDYLLSVFKTISHNHVRYETDQKPIVVDETNHVNVTLTGKAYHVKKKTLQAHFFDEKLNEKYAFSERIEAFGRDRIYRKLDRYFQVAKNWIYQDGRIIGYTYKKRKNKGERLVHVLKQNAFGPIRVTDRLKMTIARNIASMFSVFERYGLTVEIDHIYIDRHMNPYIPDLVLMRDPKGAFDLMAFHREDYLPIEHYLYENYQEHLVKVERAKKEEAERQKRLEEHKVQTTNDPESTDDDEAQSLKSFTDDEREEGFVFERSQHTVNPSANDENRPDPIRIESFSFFDKQTIRFHLGIILATILQGVHPFSGKENGESKPCKTFIRRNIDLEDPKRQQVEFNAKGLPRSIFPKYYRDGMRQTLYVKNPYRIKRTSPVKWVQKLSRLIIESKACEKNRYHYYHQSLNACPKCHLIEVRTRDKLARFLDENKRRLVDHLIFFNRIMTRSVVLLILFALIFVLQREGFAAFFERQFQNKGFDAKIVDLFESYGLGRVTDFFGFAVDGVKRLFDMIIGR
jgi:DNA-binding helix-hairpin-helix protein with protein kinase domain